MKLHILDDPYAREALWKAQAYGPHSVQRLIHLSEARHRLADCGRRLGKSMAGGKDLFHEFQKTAFDLSAGTLDRPHRWWIVGPNYDDCEKEWRVLYETCKEQKVPFDHPGTYNDTQGGNMRMSVFDGKFIVESKSAAYPDSLDGEGLDGVLVVEAAKLKEMIWIKYLLPALADKRGRSLHTSTPEGRNWFYDNWRKGQDPANHEWESWKFPSWANSVIFPGGRNDPEILSLERNMSSERFQQEIAAEFTDYVGKVFKDFDEQVHVTDLSYDPSLPLYGAVDYGWTNPFVWLDVQVDVWDNVYVIGEYRVTQRDINDIARDLKNTGRDKALRFYPDPASPGDTRVLQKALRVQPVPDTGGELKHRIEYIRKHLKLGPEHASPELQRPKLFIDRSCIGFISEMQDYRYPERKTEERAAPEIPMDKDNHGPEALGRFFRGYFGHLDTEGRSGSRVSRANIRG